MKTTSQVYSQDNRVSKLLWQVTSAAIARVHPETGGNLHIAHNWGNDEAQQLLEQFRDRQHRIFTISRELYRKAFKMEYPNHTANR